MTWDLVSFVSLFRHGRSLIPNAKQWWQRRLSFVVSDGLRDLFRSQVIERAVSLGKLEGGRSCFSLWKQQFTLPKHSCLEC